MIKTGVEKVNWNDYANSINLPVANDPKQTIYLPTYDFGIEPPDLKLPVREYPRYDLPGAGWDKSGNSPIVRLPTSQNSIFNDVPAGGLLYKLPSVVTGKSDNSKTIVGNGGFTVGGFKYDLQPESIPKRNFSPIKDRYDPDKAPLFKLNSVLLPYEQAMKYKYDPFGTKGYEYAYEIERNAYSGKSKVKELAYRVEPTYRHSIDIDYNPPQEMQRKKQTLASIPAVIMPELKDIQYTIDKNPIRKRKTTADEFEIVHSIPAIVLPPEMDIVLNRDNKQPAKKQGSFDIGIQQETTKRQPFTSLGGGSGLVIERERPRERSTSAGSGFVSVGGMVTLERPKTTEKVDVYARMRQMLMEREKKDKQAERARLKQKEQQIEQEYISLERNRQKLISKELEKTGIIGGLRNEVEIQLPLTRTRNQNREKSITRNAELVSVGMLENVLERPITRTKNVERNAVLEVGGLVGELELTKNVNLTKTRELNRNVSLQTTNTVFENPMINVS